MWVPAPASVPRVEPRVVALPPVPLGDTVLPDVVVLLFDVDVTVSLFAAEPPARVGGARLQNASLRSSRGRQWAQRNLPGAIGPRIPESRCNEAGPEELEERAAAGSWHFCSEAPV